MTTLACAAFLGTVGTAVRLPTGGVPEPERRLSPPESVAAAPGADAAPARSAEPMRQPAAEPDADAAPQEEEVVAGSASAEGKSARAPRRKRAGARRQESGGGAAPSPQAPLPSARGPMTAPDLRMPAPRHRAVSFGGGSGLGWPVPSRAAPYGNLLAERHRSEPGRPAPARRPGVGALSASSAAPAARDFLRRVETNGKSGKAGAAAAGAKSTTGARQRSAGSSGSASRRRHGVGADESAPKRERKGGAKRRPAKRKSKPAARKPKAAARKTKGEGKGSKAAKRKPPRFKPVLLDKLKGMEAIRPPKLKAKPPDLRGLARLMPEAGPDGKPLKLAPAQAAAVETMRPPSEEMAGCGETEGHWHEGEPPLYHAGAAWGAAAGGGWLWLKKSSGKWWAYTAPGQPTWLWHQGHWWWQSDGVWFMLHQGEVWGYRFFSQKRSEGLVHPGTGTQITYNADGSRAAMITPGDGAWLFDARSGEVLERMEEDAMPRRPKPRAPNKLSLPP